MWLSLCVYFEFDNKGLSGDKFMGPKRGVINHFVFRERKLNICFRSRATFLMCVVVMHRKSIGLCSKIEVNKYFVDVLLLNFVEF